MKIQLYKILSTDSYYHMIQLVQRALAEGYQPHGNLVVVVHPHSAEHNFYQPIVK